MTDRLRDHRLALSRRHLLRAFGGAALTVFGLPGAATAIAAPIFRTFPFQLGVASGEPLPDGFVIWTRLAPEPFEIGHGMPAQAVEVEWEVGADERFQTIAAKGVALARPELGHSVHVEVTGLQPGRPYWYRFVAGKERSGTGRAMTLPVLGRRLEKARFAVVGCQHYEQGYYTAHRHVAAEQPDFIYCYGDYIYEGRGNRLRQTPEGPVETVRQHLGDESYSLDDYRRRYAQYKMDSDLQAAHASAPWFATWDDHEIDNNWVDDIDQDGTPSSVFRLRKQAALQAFYENMPLRASALPVGSSLQLFRRAAYGDLIDLSLLDTRQYRTDQPCGDRWMTECTDVARANAEMLGAAQHKWLMEGVSRSDARWKVLAQQVMVMDLDRNPDEPVAFNLDSWGGYRNPRERLLRGLQERKAGIVVVLTGDEHQHYAGELHLDGRRPGREPVGIEFVATSISSGGNGQDQRPDMVKVQAANPQLKFNNSQRGYLICDVNHERFETRFRVVDKVTERGGQVSTRKALAVPAGKAELVEA